jgi:alkylation response protein AidB-like acyl-CoA dehydrogenase
MDLTDTPSAAALRAELRSWLTEHLTDDVVDAAHRDGAAGDEDARFAVLRGWNATLFDAGYAAVSWPAAHGGRDVDPVEEMVFNEEMARARAPGPVNAIGVANIGPAMLAVGTEAQKARYLRPMLRGDEIWCQGMSEPDAGSDLASLRTRAELDGDTFVINGQKTWTSEGHRADWCQLYVRTNPDVPKHKGISALLVDMSSPGIEARRIETMGGGTAFSELYFTDVRVPTSALLGEQDAGWQVATTTLGFERAGVVKLHTMVRQKLDRLRRDLVAVDPDGTGVRADRRVRDEVARRHIEVECLRLLAARAVSAAQRQRVPGPEGSVAKLRWAEAEQSLAITATRILGIGSLDEAWGHDLCSSRSLSIAGGTTEINKDILADRVLGLPRAPKPP